MNLLERVLNAIVPDEIREIVVAPIIRIGTKRERGLHINRRKKLAKRSKQRRQEFAKMKEAERLKAHYHIYPPQQGSRRPEWSSAVPGKWSELNGLSMEELRAAESV